MKSVIPTPEQMDAHERAQWAAWHEQKRQPPRTDEPQASARSGVVRAVLSRAVLWVFFLAVAAVAVHVFDGSQAAGPHLRLDLKVAGVPQ